MDKLNTDIPTDDLLGLSIVLTICAVGAVSLALGVIIVCIIFVKLNPVLSILFGIAISIGSHGVWFEIGKFVSLGLAFYVGLRSLGFHPIG